MPVFRVANLSCDLQTLKQAQEASSVWIESHGSEVSPESQALRNRIKELFIRADGTLN